MNLIRRRVLAMALVIGLFAVVLPMTFASAETGPPPNTLSLHMVSGVDYFALTNASKTIVNQQDLSGRSCVLQSTGPNLMSLSAAPAANSTSVGFSSDQLGVRVSGEGSSGKCAQVNVPNQVLTLKIDPTGPLAGRSFDYAELDIEAKFNATINIATFYQNSQVDADPNINLSDDLATPLDESKLLVKSCTTSGSDCGPDSADHDNFRIRVPTAGMVQFDEIRLWATSTDSRGAVDLQGGRDGTPAWLGGLGATYSTTDSLFHITPAASVTVTKTADDASVSAGDPIGYTITVTNNGPGNAYDVELTDTLPASDGTSWAVDVQDGTACGITSGVLSCDLGTMADDASYSVHLTSPTTSATIGAVTNSATASASNAPQASSGNVSIAVLGPGLSVTKTTDDGSVTAGDEIGFTMTVSNVAGAGNATGVTLSDTLPTDAGTSWSIDEEGSTYGSIAGNSCSISDQTLSCGPAQLPAGSSYTVHITSPTTTDTISDSPVENGVSAASTNGGSDSDSASISVWSGVLGCDPDNSTASATSDTLADVIVTRLQNTDGTDCVPKNYVLKTREEVPPGGSGTTNVITFTQEPLGQEGAHYQMEIHWTYAPITDATSTNPATVGGRTFYIDLLDGSAPHEAELCPIVSYDDEDGDPDPAMHANTPWCITGQSYTIDADGNIVLTQYWDGIGDPKMW